MCSIIHSYVTDAGQAPHFDLVFAAARLAGWVNAGQRIDHVGFGMWYFEEGVVVL